jgi:gas vesicle protein
MGLKIKNSGINRTEDDMRNKEFWIALGVGAAIGGVAALLYAPQTGTVTRKKLKRGLEDLGETLEDAGEYLKDQAEKLGKEAQKLIDASKDQFDDAIDAATGVVKSANKAARSVSKLV